MCKINFTPFPNFITERLILRQLKIEDENEIFLLRSDEEVAKFLDRPRVKNIDEARQFIYKISDGIAKNEWILWAITLKNENKLIGTICLWNISEEHSNAEIGYELLPHYQGKGIMQEALTIAVEYGFKNMKLQSIEAFVDPDNLASIKLIKRNSFIWNANFKDNNNSECKTMVIYKLLNNQVLYKA